MRVVWITGDQLHEDHPALAAADRKKDRVLFIESRKRCEQQKYHQIKLVLIFAAMRHRAAALREAGWKVDYVTPAGSFLEELETYVAKHRPESILVQDMSQYDFSKGAARAGAKSWACRSRFSRRISSSFRARISRMGRREPPPDHGASLPPRAQGAEDSRSMRTASPRAARGISIRRIAARTRRWSKAAPRSRPRRAINRTPSRARSSRW